ncbi:MAG: FtsX-like permease family protein [Mycobacteriales bacterium]
MLRATLRSLLARKLRLLLSAVAIVLGVSFVSGALVLTDTLGKTFETLFDTVNKNVAVAVRGPVTVAGSQGAESSRDPVPESVLSAVRQVDGVSEAQGFVTGSAVLIGKDGKQIGGGGPPQFGINWVDSKTLNSAYLISGHEPRSPDEIVINKGMADTSGYRVGDRADVLSQLPPSKYTIVGVFAQPGGKPSLGGETMIGFQLPAARKLLGIPAGYTEIDLAADRGVSQAVLRDRISKALPPGVGAVTGKKLSDEQTNEIKSGIGFLSTFLLVFAAVALFVGAFIIFNTFSMLVAQRTRELALFRALGASRRQVNRAVLIEAVVVGTIASALGLGLGVLVAIGLQGLFGAIGAELPRGPLVFAPRTVVAAFAVGILVTAVAAIAPARRASAVSPMAALRDAATPDRSLRRVTIIGLVVLVIGGVGMGFGLTGSGLKILGVGAILVFVGVAMLSPVVSRPVARLLGAPFQRRIPGRLGRTNTLRNPRRTASTAAALMIGLALVSTVSVLGASLKASLEKVANRTLGAEFVLATQGQSQLGFSPTVIDQLRAQPGVAQATGLAFGPAKIAARSEFVSAIAPSAVGSLIHLQRKSGSLDVRPGTVLLSERAAKQQGVHVGDTLAVQFARGGQQRFEVAGIFGDNQIVGGYVFDDTIAKNFSVRTLFAALVKLSDGANIDQVRAGINAIAKPYPNVLVQDQAEFVRSQAAQIDQLVSILYVLLTLSVLIAVLGIVNTLALSVIERTRELGLLRAIGMSRRQIKRMIRVEAVVIAVFGGLLGLVVGTGFGVAIQRSLKAQGVTELQLPWTRMAVFVLLAAAAGMVAAWLPARRGSRLNILSAIATE